jgi:nucleotide-binding universal stress UspA family protein
MARRTLRGTLDENGAKGAVMKILLAYDGFQHSKHALEESAELAAKGRAAVTILSVVPETDARGSKSGGHRWLAPHAHQDVAVAHGYLRERGIEAEMKIAYGDPTEEVSKAASEGGYDLLVVGSRGRGALGELVLGSVSQRLVDDAPCPVLIAGKDATVRHTPADSVR